MFLFLPFVDCSIKASKSFNVLKRLRIIIVPIPLHSVSVEAEIPITEQLQEPPGQRKPQDKISNQVKFLNVHSCLFVSSEFCCQLLWFPTQTREWRLKNVCLRRHLRLFSASFSPPSLSMWRWVRVDQGLLKSRRSYQSVNQSVTSQ